MRRIALPAIGAAASTLAISLIAFGCGGGGDSTVTSTTEASSTTPTQASTVTAVGTEEPIEFLGAKLTAATAGEPGVVVIEVAPDSLSRLRVGDVIIKVDGKPVASPEELIDAVGEPELGEQFTIRVIRGSKRITFAQVQSPSAFLGTAVKDTPGGDGVTVVEVEPDSPAEAAPIKPGDVIVAIDGDAIGTGDDLLAAVAAHSPGDEVTVTVLRGSDEVDLNVTLVQNPGLSG